MHRATVFVAAALVSACAAGCGGAASTRFEMVEMSRAPAPGLGEAVEVRVGDIGEGAVADIVVLERASGLVLASARAVKGAEVAFEYRGAAWVVEVLDYRDREFDGDDRATLRIRPARVTVAQN